MANQATYDDANLLLRLYELRREEMMRKARQWFLTFSPENPEHLQKVGTMGSQENAYFRMVASYWDMAASLVTAGVLNQELFLENSGELAFVWERIRKLVPETRARMNNPKYFKSLETVAQAAFDRMGKEGYEKFSAMVQGMAAANRS